MKKNEEDENVKKKDDDFEITWRYTSIAEKIKRQFWLTGEIYVRLYV